MGRANIVPLSTDSVESREKALGWTRAARKLGLGVRGHPDQSTVAVIPCSDQRLRDAAWLSRSHGVPGPDPVAAAVLSSKALAYDFLRARGFEMLFSYVPLAGLDLEIRFDRQVIVKPEYGSGTYAPHPWGYRVFASVGELRRWLRRCRLERRFFEAQALPDPRAGRYLIMEYVPTDWLHDVQCIIGDGEAVMYDQHSIALGPGSMRVKTLVLGEQLPQAPTVLAMAREFARLGLRRSLLRIQCIEREGKLYPIDFNMRIGVLVDCLNKKRRLGFYEHALRFMLGQNERMAFSWPSPRVGLHRMYLPLRPGRWRADFGEGAIPLVSDVTYDPRKPYDFGYAWPGFAVLSRSKTEALAKIESVLARTTVRRLQ
jgi:hypothetical protein